MSQHTVSLERPLLTNSQKWCTAPETQRMKAHVALAITSPFFFLKSLLNLLHCCLFYLLGFCLQGTCNLSSPTRDRTCIPRIGRQRTARKSQIILFLIPCKLYHYCVSCDVLYILALPHCILPQTPGKCFLFHFFSYNRATFYLRS